LTVDAERVELSVNSAAQQKPRVAFGWGLKPAPGKSQSGKNSLIDR